MIDEKIIEKVITGTIGSGKSTKARKIAKQLSENGYNVLILIPYRELRTDWIKKSDYEAEIRTFHSMGYKILQKNYSSNR